MVKRMDKEKFNSLMETIIRETLKKTKSPVKVDALKKFLNMLANS